MYGIPAAVNAYAQGLKLSLIHISSYDGGPWETVASLTAQDKRRSFDLPFVPRRHGTLRLRLKGRGQITLRSIAKTMAAAKGGIAGGEV